MEDSYTFTHSALVGQPPNNPRDQAIIRGMLRRLNIPDSQIVSGAPFPLPPGYQDGPIENRIAGDITLFSILMFLVIFITGYRIFLRATHPELRLGIDDAIIVVAAALAVTWHSLAICVYAFGGAGKNIWSVTYEEIFWLVRLSNTDFVIFYVAVGVAATSIACFNRRITGLSSPQWQLFHTVLLVLIVITTIIGLFMTTFRCNPPKAAFDVVAYGTSPKPPKCIGLDHLGLSLTIVQNICQFILLFVPVIIISFIRLSSATKVRLSFLFSIGSLSVIGAILCQYYQNKTYIDQPVQLRHVATWASIDLSFVIFAASLPVLNVAIPRHWLPRWIRPRTSSSPADSLGIVKTSENKEGDHTRRGRTRFRRGNDDSILNSRPDGTVYEMDERDGNVEAGSVERSWYRRMSSNTKGVSNATAMTPIGEQPPHSALTSESVEPQPIRKEAWEV